MGRMLDYYLIVLSRNIKDPCATWVGPMKDLIEAQTLNEKTGCRGKIAQVSNRFGPLSASKIVSPLNYKNKNNS